MNENGGAERLRKEGPFTVCINKNNIMNTHVLQSSPLRPRRLPTLSPPLYISSLHDYPTVVVERLSYTLCDRYTNRWQYLLYKKLKVPIPTRAPIHYCCGPLQYLQMSL